MGMSINDTLKFPLQKWLNQGMNQIVMLNQIVAIVIMFPFLL